MELTTPYENYAKTLTESTFNYSISSEEIRGGNGNALFGKYFHDSNLAVTLTDSMFKLENFAANLGVDIEEGGIVWYESGDIGETPDADGAITLANIPVAFNGSMLVWYKKPADANWSIATAEEDGGAYKITISGAGVSDRYCIKYQYQNESARHITINTQYVPRVLHVVIINDLYSGDTADVGSASKYGRIITDIPSFQLDGNQDLNLTATSAATLNLTGNALGVLGGESCEEMPYYGTMTEEIFGANWKNDVVAIAVENSDIELASGANEPLIVRAVFGGSVASQRKANSNFTFTVVSGDATVGANTGIVTGGASASVISVTLTGYPNIVGYAYITPAA